MGLVFGQPKRMKTSMVVSAFPNALWIPGEGINAIKSVAANEYGFEPIIYEHPIRTLPGLLDLLRMLVDQGLVDQYPAVCVDGFTALCDASIAYWQENPEITQSGKVDKFAPYQKLNKSLLRIAEASRHIGVNLFLVAHEQAPSNGDGGFIPGGPSLGSKKQVTRVPAWCDFNARAVVNKDYPDPWAQGGLFVNIWDSNWVTGDRNGVAYAESPPNVREILRASAVDYNLTRIPGLEWQDEVADVVADVIATGEGDDLIDQAVSAGLAAASRFVTESGRRAQLHMRWAVQDGIARGVIQRRRSVSLFEKLPTPTKKKSAGPPPPPSE